MTSGKSYEENVNLIMDALMAIQPQPTSVLIGGLRGDYFIIFYGKNLPFDIPFMSEKGKDHICVQISKDTLPGEIGCLEDLETSKFSQNPNVIKYNIKSYLWSKIEGGDDNYLCCFWDERISISQSMKYIFQKMGHQIFLNQVLVEGGYLPFKEAAPIFKK